MESLIAHPYTGIIATAQKADITPVLPLLEALEVEVISPEENFVHCPGSDRHTTANQPSDCMVYPNPDSGRPVLYCLHAHCRPVILEYNQKLALLAAKSAPVLRGRKPVSEPPAGPSIEDVNRLAANLLQSILKECKWTYSDIQNDPAGHVDLPEEEHHLCIFHLFKPDDIIWTGRDVNDTGYRNARWRFKAAKEWFAKYQCPGEFTCPSAFQQGVCSRSGGNVKEQRFLVVESDELSYDATGAVFRWLVSQGDVLRAVVDTANKSLHGWFEWPSENRVKLLKGLLPLLQCDPKMFGASQPCRLPGAIRTTGPRAGSRQRLIFFKE